MFNRNVRTSVNRGKGHAGYISRPLPRCIIRGDASMDPFEDIGICRLVITGDESPDTCVGRIIGDDIAIGKSELFFSGGIRLLSRRRDSASGQTTTDKEENHSNGKLVHLSPGLHEDDDLFLYPDNHLVIKRVDIPLPCKKHSPPTRFVLDPD
jgi:hypothetical protein